MSLNMHHASSSLCTQSLVDPSTLHRPLASNVFLSLSLSRITLSEHLTKSHPITQRRGLCNHTIRCRCNFLRPCIFNPSGFLSSCKHVSQFRSLSSHHSSLGTLSLFTLLPTALVGVVGIRQTMCTWRHMAAPQLAMPLIWRRQLNYRSHLTDLIQIPQRE